MGEKSTQTAHTGDSINPGFDGRLSFAANVISSGRATTRNFDACFENFDGDAVALALYIRAAKRPNTMLAQNLSRYITGAELLAKHPDVRSVDELRAFSLQLIAEATGKDQPTPSKGDNGDSDE